MARTAAEEKAQNFRISCKVILATILMKTKSDCWLPTLLDVDAADVGILIVVESDDDGSEVSGSTATLLGSKSGRLSSLFESF